MPKLEVSPSETIEFFEKTQTEFFQSILGMSSFEVLVTDLSQLSDFALCGDWENDYSLTGHETLNQIYDIWDKWVISTIKKIYGVEVASTSIKLTELFARIETPSPTLQ